MKHPTCAGIYSITHIKSGRRYVGSTKNIHKRWRAHRKGLQGKYHECRYLQNAWNKYGEAEFRFEILETCLNENVMLLAREQRWMDHFKGKLFNTRKFAEASGRDYMNSEAGIEYRSRRRQKMKTWWETQPTVEKKCELCGKAFQTRNVFKPTRFCSHNCIQTNRVRQFKDHEDRLCCICGKRFSVHRHKNTLSCSPECGRFLKNSFVPEDIPKILKRIIDREHMGKIAKDYGVDRHAIFNIATRRTFASIPIPPEIEEALKEIEQRGFRRRRGVLSKEQVILIRKRLAIGENQSAMAREFGVSPQLICGIKKGRSYTDF